MAQEKTPTENYIIFGFAGLLILFLLIEGLFNAFGSFYGQNAAAAGAGWKIAGLILIALSVGILAASNRSARGVTTGAVIGAGVLLVLAFCAFAGFSFEIA